MVAPQVGDQRAELVAVGEPVRVPGVLHQPPSLLNQLLRPVDVAQAPPGPGQPERDPRLERPLRAPRRLDGGGEGLTDLIVVLDAPAVERHPDERSRLARRLPHLPVQVAALRAQLDTARPAAGVEVDTPGGQQALGAHARADLGRRREQPLQPPLALGDVRPPGPEAAGRDRGQPQARLGVARGDRPLQRRAQVVELALERVEPRRLVEAVEVELRLLGETDRPREVGVANGGRLARLAQPLAPVLPQRLEQAVARLPRARRATCRPAPPGRRRRGAARGRRRRRPSRRRRASSRRRTPTAGRTGRADGRRAGRSSRRPSPRGSAGAAAPCARRR